MNKLWDYSISLYAEAVKFLYIVGLLCAGLRGHLTGQFPMRLPLQQSRPPRFFDRPRNTYIRHKQAHVYIPSYSTSKQQQQFLFAKKIYNR